MTEADSRELTEEELARIDRHAAEDIVSRHSNIGMVARARTIRRLVAALRRALARTSPVEVASIEHAIAGALRAAIHDHGPITLERIGSAVKRVVGNLRNVG